MAIHMTARYQIRPQATQACLQAIKKFVAYISENEPQTLLYVSLQETEDATSFMHYMVFHDEAAQEHHSNSQAVKRFTDILYPLTIAPVEFTSFEGIASTQG